MIGPSIAGALRHRDFRLIWLGGSVTFTGQWMQVFGLGWLVVQLAVADGTPELAPLYIGFVSLAAAVPGIPLGLFGGVLADSIDRRRILLVSQSAGGILSFALAALTLTGRISIAGVVVLAALLAASNAFDGTTRSSMVPRLVPSRDLLSAIGMLSAVWQVSTVIGPLLGGVLIVRFGVGGLFLVKALTHVPTIWAVAHIAPQPTAGRPHGQTAFGAIGEGLAFVLHDRILRWIALFLVANALILRPYVQLLPAVVHESLRLGAVELSWLLGAAGLGSFVGALFTAPAGAGRAGLVVMLGMFAGGVLLALFGAQSSLVPALVLIGLLSLVTQLVHGLNLVFLQLRTPDRLRGRVLSINNVSSNGFVPLGTMTLGAAGTVVGVGTALTAAGAVFAALALLLLTFASAIRGFETRRAQARAVAITASAGTVEAVEARIGS